MKPKDCLFTYALFHSANIFSNFDGGSGEGRREKIDQHLAGFKPQTLLLMQRLLYHWATTQLIESLVWFPLVSVVSKCSHQLTCSAFPQGAFPFQILGFREDESTDARHAKSETDQSLDKVNKGTLVWGLKGSYKSFRRVILPYHNYLAVGEWWERRSDFFLSEERREEGKYLSWVRIFLVRIFFYNPAKVVVHPYLGCEEPYDWSSSRADLRFKWRILDN